MAENLFFIDKIMKSQNKKNLYSILVNSIIRKEFNRDEINEILVELNIKEISWKRIRKSINKKKEEEEKKRKFEEEWEKKEKDEKAKRDEELRRNAMKMKIYGFTPP